MNEQEKKRKMNEFWIQIEKENGILISYNIRRLLENDIKSTDNNEYLKELKRSIPDFWDDLSDMFKTNSSATKTKSKMCKGRYKKPFEKRLHLVDFIAPITLVNLKDGSFTTHKRINWLKTCKLWNEKHPFDPMTPDTLKHEYYRAIKQEDLKEELFRRKEDNIHLSYMPIRQAIEDLLHPHPMRELTQRVVNEQQLIAVLKARIQQL